MKNNNLEVGGIVTLILGIILFGWKSLVAGLKTCIGMIVSLFKSAWRSFNLYLSGTDEDRRNLINSGKSFFKTSAIALAIVLVSGFCINVLVDGTVRVFLAFLPKFLLDAVGYLALGILLRVVVRMCEKMGVRSDITNKARKFIEFTMSVLVPHAIWTFLNYATTEGIYLMLSCCVASWAYRKINKIRAGESTTAAATN